MSNKAKQTANGNGGSKWIRKDKRLAIYLRDGFVCAFCGTDLHNANPFDVTLDHLNATHSAGNHHESNLVTACRSCNSSRQDKPLAQFATGGALKRIKNLRRRKLAPYRKLAKALIAGKAK